MTPQERDQLILKLKKLSKFTTQNGCTEAEAQAAAARIASLMATHNISMTEMELRREATGMIQDEVIEITDGPSALLGTLKAIEKLFGVRSWHHHKYEDPLELGIRMSTRHVVFFGLQADVAAAVSLGEIIQSAVITEVTKYLKELGRTRGKKHLEESFRAGMASRLSQRILDLIPTAHSTGTALVPLKNQLVTAELNRLGIGPRGTTIGFGRQLDGAAYSAGQAAASRVGLNQTQVGGTRAITHRR